MRRSRSDLPSNMELAEHVKNLASKSFSGLLPACRAACGRHRPRGSPRDQVPEKAHLGLADTVDAAEALLEPVGIPGQVIVDHQVGTLEVDAFARGIRSQQNLDLGLVNLKASCALIRSSRPIPPWIHTRASSRPKQGTDLGLEVVERVPVLGEDDDLLMRGRLGPRGCWRLGYRLRKAP